MVIERFSTKKFLNGLQTQNLYFSCILIKIKETNKKVKEPNDLMDKTTEKSRIWVFKWHEFWYVFNDIIVPGKLLKAQR